MSIQVEFKASAPPFRWDEAGGIRIGQSRVTLDSLLAAYHSGFTPEEIAFQYSVLHLEEIYAAIAYYLNHRQKAQQQRSEFVQQYIFVRSQAAFKRSLSNSRRIKRRCVYSLKN